jgi:hypothetical protein
MWTARLSELALVACLGLAALDARAEPPSPPSGDALEPYRERFKQGMDLYEHGDAAEAIEIWEPIYRDLGEQRGYRLAYDLGVAYAARGDGLPSADRLQAFLNEVDSRRARGEPLGAAVTKEESDARARLSTLAPVLGRVQVMASGRPSVVRIDSGDPHAAGGIAWVAPGQHALTFDPRTPDERTISVEVTAGAVLELVPPPPTATRPATAGVIASSSPLPSAVPGSAALTADELSEPRRAPFPPAWIAVSGGAALGTAVAAIALESHANTLRQDDIAAQAVSLDKTIPADDRSSFATARTWAYVAVGGAVALGALTAGLATWYFIGRAHDERRKPGVGVRLDGSRLVLQGGF